MAKKEKDDNLNLRIEVGGMLVCRTIDLRTEQIKKKQCDLLMNKAAEYMQLQTNIENVIDQLTYRKERVKSLIMEVVI